MSGETEANVSGWTADTIHVHLLDELRSTEKRLDEKIDAADKRYEQRFKAQEEAIAVKDKATDNRLNGMNEFRQSLTDQAKIQITRNEVAAMFATAAAERQAQTVQMAAMKERLDRSEGKGRGLDAAWGYLVGAAGVAGAVIGIIVGTR